MKAFNKDSLNANIKKMSFDEASGFSLNKLSLNIVANKDSAIINNFEIKLPETDLKIDRAHIHTGEAVSASDLLDHSPVELNIAPSQICLKDLSAFVPAFRNFSETIELSAESTEKKTKKPHRRRAIVITVVVLLNATLGFIQEHRAEAALAPAHGDVPVGAVVLDAAGR